MIYTYQIEGITVQTGDIICTMNGKPDILPGEFWRFVGRLVPGDVDHVAMYIGPDGRCVEAGARGVIKFTVFDGEWDTERMARRRGLLFDTFYGVVFSHGRARTFRDRRTSDATDCRGILSRAGWQAVQPELPECRNGRVPSIAANWRIRLISKSALT